MVVLDKQDYLNKAQDLLSEKGHLQTSNMPSHFQGTKNKIQTFGTIKCCATKSGTTIPREENLG